MKILSLLLSIYSFTCFAGRDIVGGLPVDPSDPIAKFAVAVGAIGSSGKCSGFLIHPQFVITAGHCLGNTQASYEVYFGVDVYQPEAYIKVKQFRALGGANQGTLDMALLQLERPAPDDFKPVDIIDPASISQNSTLTLAGFGQSHSHRLYKVAMSPIDYQDGLIHFKQTVESGGACYGDSGGPAIYQEGSHYAVLGITSGGVNTDCTGTVTYVQVSPHRNWISAKIQEMLAIQ